MMDGSRPLRQSIDITAGQEPEPRSDGEAGETNALGSSPPGWEDLRRVIEGEIIPRLMLAGHANPTATPRAKQTTATPTQGEVTEFASLLTDAEESTCYDYVEAMQTQGVSMETIYLHMLAPAARHLGELWNEDIKSFADVTLGLCRLHQILRRLGALGFENGPECAKWRRALMAPTPGEQHRFGVAMASDLFRRGGWDVHEVTESTRDGLASLVSCEHFDLVGMSISCESRVEVLRKVIESMREATCNDRLGIVVGGCLFTERPELGKSVGADLVACAPSGVPMPRLAETLVDLRRAGLPS